MKGSTMKRCTCPAEYDAKGRRKACPKKHGSWAYVVDVGTDPATGRRKQVKKSGFRTQAEASAAMAEVMSDVDQGQFRDDRRITFAQYSGQWLEEKRADGTLRATTYSNYRRWIGYTLPHIGALRLRDIKPHHLSTMYRAIGQANAKKGVGSTTTARIHTALSSCLGDARRGGLIRHNPASDVPRPKEQRAKVDPWTGAELGQFLDHAGGDQLGSLFELIAMGALRRGEALGLRWQDVDVEEGYLRVRQQIVAVETNDEDDVDSTTKTCPTCAKTHAGMLFGPPKTDNGEARRVDLGQDAIGVLMAQRLRQDAVRAQLGEAYDDHDLVFCKDDGSPWRPEYVTRAFSRLVKESGVRRGRLHDLRHGRASLMIQAGIGIEVISKMLGHSSIRTTVDRYAHLLDGVGRAAAQKTDQLIIRQPRDQSVTNGPDQPLGVTSQSGPNVPLTSGNGGGA